MHSKQRFTLKAEVHYIGFWVEESVDQERYIELMLERFQIDQCKPSRTPADLNMNLQTAQN